MNLRIPLMNLVVLMASLFLAGCGSQIDKSAFNDAAPELKQAWARAITADKMDDYLAANTNYVSMLRQPISPTQLVTVQSALAQLNARMNEAAAKGDAKAQKALKLLQEPKMPGVNVRR